MPGEGPKPRSRWLSGIALLGVVTASGGCVFFPPVPPVPLTQAQVTQVENCQKAVTAAGRKFVSTKLNKLEGCVQEVLKWRLRFENGLIDQAEYDAKLEATRTKCRNAYEQITDASTKFVDSVIAKCEAAAGPVLGAYDALRFQLGAEEVNGSPLTSIEELAGQLCGAKEAIVDVALTAQMPRALELLSYLGPEFYTGDPVPTDDTTIGTGVPNTILDGRCVTITPVSALQRASPLLQRVK